MTIEKRLKKVEKDVTYLLKTVNKIDGGNVKCKCGYKWRCTSKLSLVSCPDCGAKVRRN